MAKILLVEDNDDVREMMAMALEFGGHVVSSAANGRDALNMLQAGHRPGLILVDLMMPVMNGWEFRAALQEDPELSALPVVVVSAVTAENAKELGSTRCMSKPVDIDRMLELVGEYTSGSTGISGPSSRHRPSSSP